MITIHLFMDTFLHSVPDSLIDPGTVTCPADPYKDANPLSVSSRLALKKKSIFHLKSSISEYLYLKIIQGHNLYLANLLL